MLNGKISPFLSLVKLDFHWLPHNWICSIVVIFSVLLYSFFPLVSFLWALDIHRLFNWRHQWLRIGWGLCFKVSRIVAWWKILSEHLSFWLIRTDVDNHWEICLRNFLFPLRLIDFLSGHLKLVHWLLRMLFSLIFDMLWKLLLLLLRWLLNVNKYFLIVCHEELRRYRDAFRNNWNFSLYI